MAERGEEGRESVPGLEGVSQFRGPQGSQEEGVICSKSRFERRVGQENDRGCAWGCGGTELGCRGGRPDPGGAGSHFQRGGRAHALEGPKDRPSLPPLPCPPFQGMQGISPAFSSPSLLLSAAVPSTGLSLRGTDVPGDCHLSADGALCCTGPAGVAPEPGHLRFRSFDWGASPLCYNVSGALRSCAPRSP